MISVALMCMALNVYHEARGESEAGQYAVAFVTMNRAEKSNKSVCEVVTAYKQFSWTIEGLAPVTQQGKFLGYRLRDDHIPKDMVAWRKAMTVAERTLSGQAKDVTMGANHYHVLYKCRPYWRKLKNKTVVIGHHIFYRFA